MELINILQERFEKNSNRHPNMEWSNIQNRLTEENLKALKYMEETGGEPDIIGYDKEEDKYVYCDTSLESPSGRRSFCYDEDALSSRKTNKPVSSAIEEAKKHNLDLLTEEEYSFLQTLGDFDLKSTSWVLTPEEIRKEGGAIFGDKRYHRTFIYHNGAESYYSNRGFRAKIKI